MFCLLLYTFDIFHSETLKKNLGRYFLITSLHFISFVDLRKMFYLLEILFSYLNDGMLKQPVGLTEVSEIILHM